jgi:hypothetical protein
MEVEGRVGAFVDALGDADVVDVGMGEQDGHDIGDGEISEAKSTGESARAAAAAGIDENCAAAFLAEVEIGDAVVDPPGACGYFVDLELPHHGQPQEDAIWLA